MIIFTQEALYQNFWPRFSVSRLIRYETGGRGNFSVRLIRQNWWQR